MCMNYYGKGDDSMKNNKIRRKLALFMALVLTITAVIPSGFAFAESDITAETESELKVYDEEERTDLDAEELVVAEDLNVLLDSDFDVTDTFDGITYDTSKVNVSYEQERSNFDVHNAGTYDTYYKVEPVSGKQAYLIVRKVTVEEPEIATSGDVKGNSDDKKASSDEEEGSGDMVGEKADFDNYPLSEGEIESVSSNQATITIRLDEDGNVDWDEDTVEESDDTEDTTEENSDEVAHAGIMTKVKSLFADMADKLSPVMTAYAAAKGDTMKVSYSGYAIYCGHSIGIKYISESGDYYHRLVYCMDLNKGTTSGTTTATTAGSKIKPAVTYCLVNGARTLGGTCHTSKYSAGSAAADYFVTSAAIHVCNGEISLSYYNNGSTVYNKIVALVTDAKAAAKTDAYDAATGYTKSISYDISPKKSDWEEIGDGLYRTKDKFVRTKTGTITDVKYSITGAPSGLTTGEIKTDASKIDDESDLKKYDICIAQTDASSASSNFYLYCNSEAMEKILKNNSVIKVKAKAYSKEYGGRKWSPTVVSQQKITFLEQFTPSLDSATVKVTANYKEGSFSLQKTDTFTHNPVSGATYYLYEDKECEDLLCKLSVTGTDGMTVSGKLILTEDKYYLKEVLEADGYTLDENVYEIGLEYFTLYDSSGKVTQQGKVYSVEETPEPVGVIVKKTDAFSLNEIKNAGFAVFDDKACTVRTKISDGGAEVPVFYYSEDLGFAASEKFTKKQEIYYVKEVEIPDGYKDEGKVWEVKPNYGEFSTLSVTNTPIRCDVQVDKKDKETGTQQGDAKLAGAVYGLYAAEDIIYPDKSGVVTYKAGDNITSTKGVDFQSLGVEAKANTLLATVKTDENGEFNFGNLYYGNYYIKEIQESEGYMLDSTVYNVHYKEEQNTHKDISLTRHVTETVKKQAFQIVKISTDGSDDEEVEKVEGAEFTVKLQSDVDKNGWENAKTYDTLVTDEEGYAKSIELPYGTYLVRETETPEELYKVDDFQVVIDQDSREPQAWRVMNDVPFKAYIRLVKKDAESGETVLLSNVTFKIKNVATDTYVEQKVGSKKISEFTTDETGTITTPLKLKYGDYEVEEITAPEGYLITEETFPFTVTKTGAVQVFEDEDGDPVIEVEIENQPVKGSISIHKEGEVLVGTEYDTIIDRILTEITGDDRSVTFEYETQGLADAEYQLIADEDIYTPDYQVDEEGNRIIAVVNDVPAIKGAVIATLTTDENGDASIDDLPLGKYHLEEVKAPVGFVLNEEVKKITLSYVDDHTDVVYESATFANDRTKTQLSLVKTNKTNQNPVEGATYGVYTVEDIVDVDGEVLVEANSLVDTLTTDEEGKATSEADLPLGNYYLKEIEAAPGYLVDENEYPLNYTYQDQKTAIITQDLAVEETPIIVEVSKTDITTGEELVGATLEIVDSNGETYAAWKTDGQPYQLNAIPAGDYTLKETAAPYGYKIANEVDFTVEETGDIQKVAMTDERVKGRIEINKISSKDKKPIKGVTFEVRDKDGNVLQTLITDKNGYAETELLDICTYNEDGSFGEDIHYFVVETKAAEGYILDSTPHEVVLQYDEEAPEVVVYQLQLKNKPSTPKLPQTGGNFKTWIFAIVGLAVTLTGVVVYRKRRKGKRR